MELLRHDHEQIGKQEDGQGLPTALRLQVPGQDPSQDRSQNQSAAHLLEHHSDRALPPLATHPDEWGRNREHHAEEDDHQQVFHDGDAQDDVLELPLRLDLLDYGDRRVRGGVGRPHAEKEGHPKGYREGLVRQEGDRAPDQDHRGSHAGSGDHGHRQGGGQNGTQRGLQVLEIQFRSRHEGDQRQRELVDELEVLDGLRGEDPQERWARDDSHHQIPREPRQTGFRRQVAPHVGHQQKEAHEDGELRTGEGSRGGRERDEGHSEEEDQRDGEIDESLQLEEPV